MSQFRFCSDRYRIGVAQYPTQRAINESGAAYPIPMGAGQETPKSSDRAVLRLTVSRQLDCNIAGLHGAKNLIDQISTTTELRRVRNAVCTSNFPAERAFIARQA